ncbi:MAG: L,D-transpeptidase family protein [Pseudomonadota bacterium]
MRLVLVFLSLFALTGSSFAASDGKMSDPLHIMVSLEEQQIRVFQGQDLITQSNISSGKSGHETPTGIFSVLQKNRYHRSNIYSNAPMPFMQRLTWSGIALHASNSVPSHPASHGCVRLPHKFASQLFKLKTMGAHVVIESNPQAPRKISHKLLPDPKNTWQPSAEYDSWVNDKIKSENFGMIAAKPNYASRILITRRTYKDDLIETQRLLNKLGFDAGSVDGIMGPVTWGAISRFQETEKIEVNGKIDNTLLDALYSKAKEIRPANGRIMVRQHHRTVYDAEIQIKSPEIPLGSHLLTASGFNKEKSKTDWLYVSLKDRVQTQLNLKSAHSVDPTTKRRSVHAALSRIVMTNQVRRQISRLLTQGSSIAISDNGLSIETGAKGTDFIVLTKPDSLAKEYAGQVQTQTE